MLQAAGTKFPREYIKKRQATVEEWVVLQPIFEVCAKESGYAEGGEFQEPWWQQESSEQQLGDMLKNISKAARERRRQ